MCVLTIVLMKKIIAMKSSIRKGPIFSGQASITISISISMQFEIGKKNCEILVGGKKA